MSLEVAGEAAVAADPSNGALDDPSLRQHDKAVAVAAATISILHKPVRIIAAAMFDL